MLNYIKAECFKTFKRSYTRITALVFVVLAVLMNLFYWVTLRNGAFENTQEVIRVSLATAVPMLLTLVYLILILVDIVFSEEYKYKTFKNTLSFGFTRTQVYFGKLIVSGLVTTALYLLTLAAYLISLFLIIGIPDDLSLIWMLLNRVLAAAPLYIGALCLCNACAFIIPNSTAFSFVYIGIFTVPYLFFYTLTLMNPIFLPLFKAMLVTPFYTVLMGLNAEIVNLADMMGVGFKIGTIEDISGLTYLPGSSMAYCLILGLAYAVITTLIGLAVYRRREIR